MLLFEGMEEPTEETSNTGKKNDPHHAHMCCRGCICFWTAWRDSLRETKVPCWIPDTIDLSQPIPVFPVIQFLPVVQIGIDVVEIATYNTFAGRRSIR